MSPEKLKRRALALGAELEIDGKTINAARQQLRVVPARSAPQEPAAPAAAADPMAMIAQAMTLQMRALAELLDKGKRPEPPEEEDDDDKDEAPEAPPVPAAPTPRPSISGAAMSLMDSARSAAAEPVAPKPTPPAAAAPARLVMPVLFKVVRDATGWAQSLQPTYGEVRSTQLAGLDTTVDSRGLIETITPSYA